MDGSSILNLGSNLLLFAQANLEAGAPATPEPTGTSALVTGLVFVLGIFVVPFILSHFITSAVRMPTHSFRVGVMIAAIFGGILFAWNKDFELKKGIDMSGGTTLVYNIEKNSEGGQPDASKLSGRLSQRIDPSGTKQTLIRPRGSSQIEVIVPTSDELEIARIKKGLTTAGQMEFRIVANTRDHDDVVALAKAQADAPTINDEVKDDEGTVVGHWYEIGRQEVIDDGNFPLLAHVGVYETIRNRRTGEIITPGTPTKRPNAKHQLEAWLDEQGIEDIDMLMSFQYAKRPFPVVTGEDLSSATESYNKTGQPIVEFSLNAAGGARMTELTGGINQPEGDFRRRMAIIMDKKVLSAPNLESTISDRGQNPGNFTQDEVRFLVEILRSGSLPAALEETPASEYRVGAGLGATTIEKGTRAALGAIIATFLCILVYYRFAGIVASIALLINGLLIFGVMIFIGQPLTLPGLAGLVLTVGMSVDANVLIFERIREEKAKGAAPRMSIRNGFDRAFTTIIDSNLTTLIAAIVLYWIGTDQVRGFAVALIIGIATSLFTATFCSRIIFEICEKLKLVSLSMSDGVGMIKHSITGEGDINFMGWTKASFVVSTLLIVLGLAAVVARVQQKNLLNIDFTGGTSVTFQLHDAVQPDRMRELTRGMLNEDEQGRQVQSSLVQVEMAPLGTVYTLVSSIDDTNYLSEQLVAGFKDNPEVKLVTYRVEYQPTAAGGASNSKPKKMHFVSFQNNDAESEGGETPPAGDGPAAPDSETQDSESSGETASIGAEPAPQVSTSFTLKFGASNDVVGSEGTKVDAIELKERVVAAAEAAGVALSVPNIDVLPADVEDSVIQNFREEDMLGFTDWTVTLPVEASEGTKVLAQLESGMQQEPKWLSLSTIGNRVAGEMKQRAIAAILLSLIFIVAYIWFRFQQITFGLAAVVALVHDVLIVMGMMALASYASGNAIGELLLFNDFRINLPMVAAFLTIVGYSLNDTIVVFDRIREVRGKNPNLTTEIVNESLNQTLSRTLLTSLTTFLVVIILYSIGGEGIHGFAFCLTLGVIVGTYSSIYVASPVLVWLMNRHNKKPA